MVRPSEQNRGLASLVERQMRKWEINHEQKLEEPQEKGPELKFYIAISRESGCSEDEIADKIVERTGFQKYNQELLDYMVTKSDIRRQLYETLDDRTQGWIESLISNMSFGPTVDLEEYYHRLCHAIFAICTNTHAIIVGRGANYILPKQKGLAVRLVAPYSYRVDNYARQRGIDLAHADRSIRDLEKWRGQFIEEHFGRFAFDPRRFDLVINVSQFTTDEVAEMITGGLKIKAGADFVLPRDQKVTVFGRG